MVIFESKWNLHAGLHWWKPRPSGRTQSSLKSGGFFLSTVRDGEYVAGVAPPLPAILHHYASLYFLLLLSFPDAIYIGYTWKAHFKNHVRELLFLDLGLLLSSPWILTWAFAFSPIITSCPSRYSKTTKNVFSKSLYF